MEKAYGSVGEGKLSHYAAEIVKRERDPYSVMEEIVGGMK